MPRKLTVSGCEETMRSRLSQICIKNCLYTHDGNHSFSRGFDLSWEEMRYGGEVIFMYIILLRVAAVVVVITIYSGIHSGELLFFKLL